MAKNPRSRSSELTGGDGFTYEDTVAAWYLAALLREEPAPGTRGTVVRVAVQQKALGDPLDDLIVDSDEAGVRTRLSLQVKKQVTVSSSNGDFTEIIAEAVATRARPEFQVGKDRYGFIVRSISISGLENLDRIIGFATASTNGQEFVRRFAPQAEANASMIAMRDDVRSMIGPADDDAEWDFYRHFVAYRLDNLRDGEDRFVELSNRLNVVAEAPGSNIVPVVCQEVRRGESKAKVWTRNSLIADLRTKVSLRVAPTYDRDLKALSDIARNYVEEIRADIGGTTLDRDGLIEAAESAASK
ncbi:MAG TPA: hypothetical protein VFE10_14015, partial [Phenylobacterium sp.]|nr:hypothetical protein [Phenylobacterium sp.]